MSRVVITGMGLVCGLGADRDTVVKGARSGTRPFGPVQLFDASAFKANLASHVPRLDIEGRFGAATRRNTSRTDQFALWATADALEQAALSKNERSSAAVFVGASTGGMLEMEEARLAAPDGAPSFHGYWRYPVWGSALALARVLDLQGPASTYMTACSSAAHALGMAMHRIRRGEIECAVAGGTESLARLTLAGFGSLGVLDPEGTRPFDANRKGITLGEGAAFFVLESDESARRAGREAMGYLSGYGSSSDAAHMVQPREDGGGAHQAMESALRDAGLSPDAIDYVNAHGTGTIQNDVMEAKALRRLFGERDVAVSSSKSMLGHTLGACGALELGLTLLGMNEGFLPPSAGVDTPAPELEALRLVREAGTRGAQAAISTSFAFGGNNVALVLQAPATEATSVPSSIDALSVVITGGAIAGPAGCQHNVQALAQLSEQSSDECRQGGFVDLDPGEVLGKRTVRRMDPLSAAATAVARLALDTASLEPHSNLGVTYGTGFGALDPTIKFLERLFEKGPGLVNPLEFPNLVHNAPAGYIALNVGGQGHNLTACQEELAGDEAVVAAWELISHGRGEQYLSGGGDLASEWLDRGYKKVDALFGTESRHSSITATLVLESTQAAEKRGAKPWARIAAIGKSSQGEGAERAIRSALAAAPSDLPSIERWYKSETEALTHRAEDVELAELSSARVVRARHVVGDACGAGPSTLAMAAAAIAQGDIRCALVTSVTRRAMAVAYLLAAP